MITNDKLAAYLENVDICPYCGGAALADDNYEEWEDTWDLKRDNPGLAAEVSQAAVCIECGKHWKDIYTLNHIEESP